MATVETTRTTASNGSSAGFKVNEIRSATEEDFQHFVRLADEYKEGTRWTRKLEKNGIAIWQKDTGASPIKMALVSPTIDGAKRTLAIWSRKTWILLYTAEYIAV